LEIRDITQQVTFSSRHCRIELTNTLEVRERLRGRGVAPQRDVFVMSHRPQDHWAIGVTDKKPTRALPFGAIDRLATQSLGWGHTKARPEDRVLGIERRLSNRFEPSIGVEDHDPLAKTHEEIRRDGVEGQLMSAFMNKSSSRRRSWWRGGGGRRKMGGRRFQRIDLHSAMSWGDWLRWVEVIRKGVIPQDNSMGLARSRECSWGSMEMVVGPQTNRQTLDATEVDVSMEAMQKDDSMDCRGDGWWLREGEDFTWGWVQSDDINSPHVDHRGAGMSSEDDNFLKIGGSSCDRCTRDGDLWKVKGGH
jgi:hypothetical protein